MIRYISAFLIQRGFYKKALHKIRIDNSCDQQSVHAMNTCPIHSMLMFCYNIQVYMLNICCCMLTLNLSGRLHRCIHYCTVSKILRYSPISLFADGPLSSIYLCKSKQLLCWTNFELTNICRLLLPSVPNQERDVKFSWNGLMILWH